MLQTLNVNMLQHSPLTRTPCPEKEGKKKVLELRYYQQVSVPVLYDAEAHRVESEKPRVHLHSKWPSLLSTRKGNHLGMPEGSGRQGQEEPKSVEVEEAEERAVKWGSLLPWPPLLTKGAGASRM